jgi:methyltransferase (TIGR00027 family)
MLAVNHWRQPAWAQNLKIFEIDQPSTQEFKRTMLKAAGLAIPSNTQLGTIDFEIESFYHGLIRNRVAMDQPAFFSWLGVMVYLKEDEIESVLHTVAGFPRGSQIVLTYSRPPKKRQNDLSGDAITLSERVARAGEPFISYFEPEALTEKLQQSGFSSVQYLSLADIRNRYFPALPDNLPGSGHSLIVSAMV